MLKKMLFAAAITGLVAGATIPLHATSAEASPSKCWKAAKARFPGAHNYKMRHQYRVACRAHYKAYKATQKA